MLLLSAAPCTWHGHSPTAGRACWEGQHDATSFLTRHGPGQSRRPSPLGLEALLSDPPPLQTAPQHALALCDIQGRATPARTTPPRSTARQQVWEPGRVMPLGQLLLNTVLGLLGFYMSLSSSLSVSAQTGTWGFDRDCMKSADHTGSTAISRAPSLPSHELRCPLTCPGPSDSDARPVGSVSPHRVCVI